MLINSIEAMVILSVTPADLDFGEQWPILLNLIYTKREEAEISLPVEDLKDIIRQIPLDKALVDLRRKIAFEILELSYPDDVPLSDAELDDMSKVKTKIEAEAAEAERVKREAEEAEIARLEEEARLEQERLEQERLEQEEADRLASEEVNDGGSKENADENADESTGEDAEARSRAITEAGSGQILSGTED